jgi:hypothetical protein
VVEAWLSLPDDACPAALEGELWTSTLGISQFFRSQALPPLEDSLLARIRKALREEPSDRSACAALPFLGQLGDDAERLFPAASRHLRSRLLPILMFSGIHTQEQEAAEACRQLEALLDQILAQLPELAGEEREHFLLELRSCQSMIPFYFLEWDLPRVAAKRTRLLKAVYEWPGLQAEYAPVGPIPATRRIRVGILARGFDARSETYALLPVFEQLDSSRFETVLLALNRLDTPTESYCGSRAERVCLLPQDLPSMVAAIRAHDLDILLFGNNLSAGLAQLDAALALHRLARIQVNFICSPITSGLPQIDYFLQGCDSEEKGGEQDRYTERLAQLAGSGFCFSFAGRDEAPGRIWKRTDLGLLPKDVVFVSGANYYKVGPQVQRAWSRILAAVPGSQLLLYPFGPAWSQQYPTELFVQSMLDQLSQHQVADDRLVVVGAMKNVQEIRSLLRCADVYLDAFPYSGAASLQDPLDVGMPMVVLEGRELRFRQGASMLREAGLELLVTNSPETYQDLAVRLGREAEFRARTVAQVQAVMDGVPPFRDKKSYGDKVAAAFEEMVKTFNAECFRRSTQAGAPPTE